MKAFTPPQRKLINHIQETGQVINIDSRGRPYLADGTQVNQLTLRALVSRGVLRACASDLFGNGVSAYEVLNGEVSA